MSDLFDENLILAYVEGDLPNDQRHEFKLALIKDAKLRRLVEQLEADRQALRVLPEEPAPPSLMDHVHQHMERDLLLGPQTPAEAPRPLPFVRLAAWTAMAAMLVLGASLIYQTWMSIQQTSDTGAPQVAMQRADEATAPQPTVEAVDAEPAQDAVVLKKMERKEQAIKSVGTALAMAGKDLQDVLAKTAAKPAPAPTMMRGMMAADEDVAAAAPPPAEMPFALDLADIMSKPAVEADDKADAPLRYDPGDPSSGIGTAMPMVGLALTESAPVEMVEKDKDTAPIEVATTPSPRNLALAIRTANPESTFQRVIEWADAHEATISFARHRNLAANQLLTDPMLPKLGRVHRRIRLRIKADQLMALTEHFDDANSSAQLVREPRPRRRRSLDPPVPPVPDRPQTSTRRRRHSAVRRDLGSVIAQELPIDPTTLRLRPDQTMTVAVILREPLKRPATSQPN